ncbi:hypothetical protein [Nodosilinea sp. FACHB-13]|uniref:hypothetical protein n=1 Tax=Cyanophyceae TaxID=3028117 RepID=UPI001684F267|nr:hypothetical protein [Nodosilinea sp. FACHB-13]MBD2106268.1 hypothetical protein [Nodosilinea sp. FACHB-13]
MTSLDDLTLLQWFVSGDATLEANQSLRIQPANNVRQLLGRKGSLLAIAYDATTPARIEVRRHTDYTDVLHQVLIDHHFLPVGQGLDSQVLCYAHHPIPQGYRVNYAAARQLWKQWWMQSSRRGKRPLQLDLLVLSQNQWYPVRDIAINSGTLYVDTLRGENVYHGDDMVAWLEKERCEEGDKTFVWTSPPAQAVPTPPEPPAAATVPARAPAPAPRPAPPPRSPVTLAPLASIDPTLAPVVYALDGKVYIQTAVGVVVVEGQGLKAYKSLHQPAIAPDRLATVTTVRQRFR